MEQGIDKMQALLLGQGQTLLGDLTGLRQEPQPESVVLAAGCWTVCLLTFQTPPIHIPGLSTTELAILQVLARFPDDRLSCPRILEELAKDRSSIYADCLMGITASYLSTDCAGSRQVGVAPAGTSPSARKRPHRRVAVGGSSDEQDHPAVCFRRRQAHPAIPAMPMPSRVRVEGSGTAATPSNS